MGRCNNTDQSNGNKTQMLVIAMPHTATHTHAADPDKKVKAKCAITHEEYRWECSSHFLRP